MDFITILIFLFGLPVHLFQDSDMPIRSASVLSPHSVSNEELEDVLTVNRKKRRRVVLEENEGDFDDPAIQNPLEK